MSGALRRTRAPALAAVALALAASACTHAAPPDSAPLFGTPVRVNDAFGAGYGQAEPVLAADSAGNVVVSWIDWSPPRPTVRLAFSSNGAASFGASIAAAADDGTAHPEGQADPSLLRTPGGDTLLAWMACRKDGASVGGTACDLYGRRSGDAGRTWSPVFPVAAGGATYRDRPWLATDGTGVWASWLEERVTGPRWVVAARSSSGAFVESGAVDGRAGMLPLEARAPGILEALVADRTNRDPSALVLDRVRSADGGKSFATPGTIRVSRAAVLLDFSVGALAVRPDGESWLAIPRGTGTRNDFLLARRPAALDVYETVGTLRQTREGRVGLPWIEPMPGGRFLAAWIEESEADEWRLLARTLGPGTKRSAAADVARDSFRIQPASLTLNIGDSLAVVSAGGSVWIAWSDTTGGDADVRVARGKIGVVSVP